MRVLFVESGTELGGSQLALLSKLAFLDRSIITPIFASLGFGRGDFPDRIEKLGISTYRLPAGRFRNACATITKIGELVRITRRERIDVIFSNSGHPLLYARPAASLTVKPCVWWVHGYLENDTLKGHIVPYLEQLLQSDLMIANSRYTAAVLARVFPHRALAPVVPCGIDCDAFAPLADRDQIRAELGLARDEIVLGMFGRLHPFKGQDVFLRAARVLRTRGLRPRLLFVGGTPFDLSPGYADWLERYTRELDLQEQAIFLGQRSDINSLLGASDVVVHASVEPEPWGLVVAEGMSAGRPVVASAGGGPAEMIQHGQTGFLTPLGDHHALAETIALLIKEPLTRKRVSENARSHAILTFDIRSTVRRLEDCLLRAARMAA